MHDSPVWISQQCTHTSRRAVTQWNCLTIYSSQKSCLYWIKCRIKADIAYSMLKWKRRQSTADPPMVKSKITYLWCSQASMSSRFWQWWSWTAGSWIVVSCLRHTCTCMLQRMWGQTSCDPFDVTIVTWRHPYHVTWFEPPIPNPTYAHAHGRQWWTHGRQ